MSVFGNLFNRVKTAMGSDLRLVELRAREYLNDAETYLTGKINGIRSEVLGVVTKARSEAHDEVNTLRAEVIKLIAEAKAEVIAEIKKV